MIGQLLTAAYRPPLSSGSLNTARHNLTISSWSHLTHLGSVADSLERDGVVINTQAGEAKSSEFNPSPPPGLPRLYIQCQQRTLS